MHEDSPRIRFIEPHRWVTDRFASSAHHARPPQEILVSAIRLNRRSVKNGCRGEARNATPPKQVNVTMVVVTLVSLSGSAAGPAGRLKAFSILQACGRRLPAEVSTLHSPTALLSSTFSRQVAAGC